jgi:hypothetical protein
LWCCNSPLNFSIVAAFLSWASDQQLKPSKLGVWNFASTGRGIIAQSDIEVMQIEAIVMGLCL